MVALSLLEVPPIEELRKRAARQGCGVGTGFELTLSRKFRVVSKVAPSKQ